MSAEKQQTAPPTDSPWLWIGIFLAGGVIALALMAPKYNRRQPQIEREYQARERAGNTISSHGGPQPLSQPGRPMISLRPLMLLICGAWLVATITFWIVRLRSRKR